MAKPEPEPPERIEELVRRLDEIQDAHSRETARALVEAILALHGAGLEQMVGIVRESGEAGLTVMAKWGDDSLTGGLLALHGLHPDPIEARVGKSLRSLPFRTELVQVTEAGGVHIRLLQGGCGIEQKVEALIREAVPDVEGITFEQNTPADGFVPLASLGSALRNS